MCTNTVRMITLLVRSMELLDRFERWFNDRFGWFFTNGMKTGSERKPHLR